MKLNNIICIVFCVFQASFGAMGPESLQISVFKDNSNTGKYVCGQNLIVEENNDVRLKIHSPNKFVYHAWCDRNDGRNVGIKIQNGHFLYADIRGDDDNEGKWICTMLINKNVNVNFLTNEDRVITFNNKNYLKMNCELNVIVKRYITLKISNKTDGTNFKVTSDRKHYFYAPGQIVDLKCVKNNETQEALDSGIMELAICNEIAPADKLCSGVSNSTNRVIELKKTAIKENCTIRCTFKSGHGIKTSAEIVLKLKDMKLQKITVDDNDVWKKDDYFVSEVARNESGDSVVKCTKSEDQYYGSLHWEYCGKENGGSTSTCEIHAKKYENMITWPISRQKQTADILKCVYTYDSRSPIRKAVLLTFRVIEPPHISIQNSNNFEVIETQYGYTAEGVVGQSMIIECINRQSNGFIIWSYCKKGKCTPGEKYMSTKLQHVFELKMDSNDMKIRCVFISEGKLEINSKEITIRVKEDTKPAGKPASHSTSYNNNFKPTGKPASYWNPALSPETNAPSTERSVSPIHNLIQISRESAYFGEEVNIWCGTEDTEKRNFSITIKPEKGIKFNLKGKNSQDFHSFEANYTMNYTEPLDISCFVYNINGEKIQEDTIKLNYSEPVIATTESALVTTSAPLRSGSPNYLIIGALGAGILIVIIIIIAIWNAIRKSKAKTKQRKSSVTYENLSNEHQRPTPPFPRGAKLEETYLAPADMREPNAATPEETYAQPFKPTLEDLYSKPLKNRDKAELYTQVLPKHQRKANSNELNYAEIEVESRNVNANKYVNVDEGNYATITDQGYANLAVEAQKMKNERDRKDKGDYTNVFENEPYINSKSKCEDYAEPSYCQISQFKN